MLKKLRSAFRNREQDNGPDVLARLATGPDVPEGWHGMRVGPLGEVREYVGAGARLQEVKGDHNWWVRAGALCLPVRPARLGDGWCFEFAGGFVDPAAPEAIERGVRALAYRLGHLNAHRERVWRLQDLAAELAAGHHWQLWPPTLMQAGEAAAVRSDAADFLARETGFMLQKLLVLSPESAAMPGDAAQGDTAIEGSMGLLRPARADMRRLCDEDDLLGLRLFRELPELSSLMHRFIIFGRAPEALRARWRQIDRLARSINRFTSPIDEERRIDVLALQEGVRALRAACDAVDELGRLIVELEQSGALASPGGAQADLALRQLDERIEILQSAVALRRRAGAREQGPPPVTAVHAQRPQTCAAETWSSRECSVLVALDDRCAIRVRAALLPDADPGVVKVLTTVQALAALTKPLRTAIRALRAHDAAQQAMPPGVCLQMEWVGPLVSGEMPAWQELEFAFVLADSAVRGRLGPLPECLLTAPLRIDPATLALCMSATLQDRSLSGIEAALARQPGDVVFLPQLAGADALATLEKIRTCSGGLHTLSYLNELWGQFEGMQAPGTRRAVVHFPVVVGGPGEQTFVLRSLTLTLRIAPSGDAGLPRIRGGFSQEHDARRQRLARLLAAARAADKDEQWSRDWDTEIAFSGQFSGNSWELALVLADRLARGRLHASSGHLIATGAIAVDADDGTDKERLHQTLAVRDVEGDEVKLCGIAELATQGDRVLLPSAWETRLTPKSREALRVLKTRNARCVLISQAFR